MLEPQLVYLSKSLVVYFFKQQCCNLTLALVSLDLGMFCRIVASEYRIFLQPDVNV